MTDKVEHPVAYASRTLTKAERNYFVTRKELLAVVDFVKHFRHYLQEPKFRIRTDHAPLHTVLKVKELEGQLARWTEFMDSYGYEIEYRKIGGIKMQMKCHEDFVVVDVNGVRTGRRLNTWLVLRLKLMFHRWV